MHKAFALNLSNFVVRLMAAFFVLLMFPCIVVMRMRMHLRRCAQAKLWWEILLPQGLS